MEAGPGLLLATFVCSFALCSCVVQARLKAARSSMLAHAVPQSFRRLVEPRAKKALEHLAILA